MTNTLTIPEELIAQRKQLRKQLLVSIYENNFATVGRKMKLMPNISEDKEEATAYLYLIESGLVFSESHSGGLMTIKISPAGIDFVENGLEF